MAEKLSREHLARHAEIHDGARVTLQPPVDRTFELPVGLHVTTAVLFLAFIGILGTGFANPEMIIPVAIFALFIAAFFGVPAIWTRLAPATGSRALSWGRFRQEGIMTGSGHATARDASVQVLILPVLIVFWAMVVVTIAATV